MKKEVALMYERKDALSEAFEKEWTKAELEKQFGYEGMLAMYDVFRRGFEAGKAAAYNGRSMP